MARRLPYLYAAVTLFGTVLLSWRYSVDPPAASDPLSLALGWGGLLAMVIMLVYSVARRSRRLRQIARLSYWLHFHIFLGVAGPIMALFHSLPLFMRDAPIRPLNPGLLNLAAVAIVFSSGLFGRYLYSMIPRAQSGERLDGKETRADRLFRRWIVLHRPIASVMYVLSVMHIVLAYMFSPALAR